MFCESGFASVLHKGEKRSGAQCLGKLPFTIPCHAQCAQDEGVCAFCTDFFARRAKRPWAPRGSWPFLAKPRLQCGRFCHVGQVSKDSQGVARIQYSIPYAHVHDLHDYTFMCLYTLDLQTVHNGRNVCGRHVPVKRRRNQKTCRFRGANMC